MIELCTVLLPARYPPYYGAVPAYDPFAADPAAVGFAPAPGYEAGGMPYYDPFQAQQQPHQYQPPPRGPPAAAAPAPDAPVSAPRQLQMAFHQQQQAQQAQQAAQQQKQQQYQQLAAAQQPSKDRKVVREIAGQKWVDNTLNEWPENDHRIFVGNLHPDVNENMLQAAFTKYPSFVKCKVVRDKFTKKSKG